MGGQPYWVSRLLMTYLMLLKLSEYGRRGPWFAESSEALNCSWACGSKTVAFCGGSTLMEIPEGNTPENSGKQNPKIWLKPPSIAQEWCHNFDRYPTVLLPWR
jgi:hypothetical protein